MSAPGYQLPRDPTAVMGSRIGAWVVDALLVLLMLLFLGPTPLSPFAKYHEDLPAGIDGYDACEILEDSGEANACIGIGDRVYYTEDSVAWLPVAALAAYWLLVLGVLQGVTGWTPGKLLFGLRVVGEDGQTPGVGRALIRSLLWVVDSQPCGVPLVGLITGLTSTGHRRVGDMAAKTYVIRTGDVGRPVVVPGVPGTYGYAQSYAGYPGYGTPGSYPGYGTPAGYGSAPGAAPGQAPGQGQWGAAPPPPAGPWGAAAPAPPRPAPPATGETPVVATPPAPPSAGASGPTTGQTEVFSSPPPAAAPAAPADAAGASEAPESAEPEAAAKPEVAAEAVSAPADDPATPSTSAAETAATATPSGETPAVETEVVSVPETAPTEKPDEPKIQVGPSSPPPEGTRPEYNPQWDAARGTYIQWDANRSRWLQWDDTAKEWKPI